MASPSAFPRSAPGGGATLPPMRLLLLLLPLLLAAAEPAATFARNRVQVAISVEASATSALLVAVFTPDPGHHLYSKDLPDGPRLPGKPTRLDPAPGAPVRVLAPLQADQPTHDLHGLAVYPDGPVTLRLTVSLPPGPVGSGTPVRFRIGYMACTADSCLVPVEEELTLGLPNGGEASTTPGPAAAPSGLDEAMLRRILSEQRSGQAEDGIAWRRPRDRNEAEALIAEARRAGRTVLLDFTGPSCNNCQRMAQTVFRRAEVRRILAGMVAVEIDTDPPHADLAAWQQERFRSQNRPLYVRLAPDGGETRWSEMIAPPSPDDLERFLVFLRGGDGSDAGLGAGWGFVLLALAGGLLTLLAPCTYPMIPFTLNFFAKQAAQGRRIGPLALAYGAGIMACFIGLGLLITGVVGTQLSTVAGHPITNLAIAAIFALMGLALLGAFLLRLPGPLNDALSGTRGGYLGALVMGLTFAITAFSCTAPFAGSVLAAAVTTGSWGTAVLGMAIYSLAVAVPFTLLALAPGLLKALPRAGGWMNEFKVVGGLVELAAALKFLVICDWHWHWGIFTRGPVLAAWTATCLLIAAYLAGWLRLHDDARVEGLGLGRLLAVLAFAALGFWLFAGLLGGEVGLLEGFFPA